MACLWWLIQSFLWVLWKLSWSLKKKNIADTERSSNIPGLSYKRYGELILYKQISLTIAWGRCAKEKKSSASWFSLRQHSSPLPGFIQNLKTLALITGEKSDWFLWETKKNGQIKRNDKHVDAHSLLHNTIRHIQCSLRKHPIQICRKFHLQKLKKKSDKNLW